MLSLLSVTLGGAGWIEIYNAARELGDLYAAILLLFLLFWTSVLSNSIAAVVVDMYSRDRQSDFSATGDDLDHKEEKTVAALVHLFHIMDQNGNGIVSLAEFRLALEDKSLTKDLKAL